MKQFIIVLLFLVLVLVSSVGICAKKKKVKKIILSTGTIIQQILPLGTAKEFKAK